MVRNVYEKIEGLKQSFGEEEKEHYRGLGLADEREKPTLYNETFIGILSLPMILYSTALPFLILCMLPAVHQDMIWRSHLMLYSYNYLSPVRSRRILIVSKDQWPAIYITEVAATVDIQSVPYPYHLHTSAAV